MASIRKTESGKWQARISIKGQAKSIGRFDTKREAEEQAAIAERLFKDGSKTERTIAFWEKQVRIMQSELDDFRTEKDMLTPIFGLRAFGMQEAILIKAVENAQEALEAVKNIDMELIQ